MSEYKLYLIRFFNKKVSESETPLDIEITHYHTWIKHGKENIFLSRSSAFKWFSKYSINSGSISVEISRREHDELRALAIEKQTVIKNRRDLETIEYIKSRL